MYMIHYLRKYLYGDLLTLKKKFILNIKYFLSDVYVS